MISKTDGTLTGVLEVEYQRCIRIFLVGLMLLVVDCLLFFRHHEALVGVEVEEHDEDITVITVSAMVLITPAVTLEEHGLTAQNPMRIEIGIAAVGEVVRLLLARCIDETDVVVVIATVAEISGEQPLAVGTPLEIYVAIGVREDVLTVHNCAYLLRCKIDYAQSTAVLEESNLLAVRTVLGLQRCLVVFCELLLNQLGGIGELLLVLIFDLGLIDVPASVALRSIYQAASVGAKANITLHLGSIGDALSCLVFNRSNVNIAVHNEGNLLAAGRCAYLGSTLGVNLGYEVTVYTIGYNADVYTLRLFALTNGVDLAIVGIAQSAVV